MSFFVQSTPASLPKTKNVQAVSIALAAVFVVMAVAQLFTFETFWQVIASMQLPGGDSAAHIRAAVIVIFEVLALPFLLFMRLSPLMRIISMVSGWIVVSGWLVASLWQNLMPLVAVNSGLLGDTISLPVGWWSVLFCTALGILAAWAAWGMWPRTRRHM